MLIDARAIPHSADLPADICIVGAGAAGIFLALRLAGAGFDTLVLEAGGVGADQESQALYDGEIVGLPLDLAGTRTRQLGGSTNCWGGFCLPLDRHLLGARPWIGDAGWPIPAEELISFYRLAAQFLDVPSDGFDTATLERSAQLLLPLQTDRLKTGISQIVTIRRRFGRYFREELRSSSRIRILLHATATELLTDDAGRRVTGVTVATAPERRFFARSAIVILAAGGIENARLMLLSRDRHPGGIGNRYDLVGRYFMDHPCVDLAKVTGRDRPARARLYDTQYAVHSSKKCLGLQVRPEIQAREHIAGAWCFLEAEAYGEESGASESLKTLYKNLRRRRRTSDLGRHLLNIVGGLPAAVPLVAWHALGIEAAVKFRTLRAVIEPLPNPNSRITLSADRDRFGMNRTCLDWRLDETDRRTVRRTTRIVCSALQEAGGMVVEPLLTSLDGSCLNNPQGTWHHIGTTRMATDPREGVVDINCRVHELDNLFVAGSSVFPAAGNHSPTFTILALTARLTGHIIDEFSRARIGTQHSG